MKVWVPGASGMLGQAVTRRLTQAGLVVAGTGHQEVDIADAMASRRYLNRTLPDAVVNCAAFTQVDECETRAAEAERINARGPATLAAACRRLRIPIATVSTDYVFDGTAAVDYDEDQPPRPVSVYGRSKLDGELAFLSAMQEAPVPHYVVRTSWLFADHGRNFVLTMLRLLGERDRVGVVADQVGRPTATGDLADVLLRLLGLTDGEPARSGLYHFANAGAASWFDLAVEVRRLAEQAGLPLRAPRVTPIATSDYPTAARRPARSVLATTKIEAALGRTPRPWQEALGEVVANVASRSLHA